jgi:hypothetical protein
MALAQYLARNSGLNALVGERIYPVTKAQMGALPYVTYQRISTRYVQAHGEYSALPTARVQFNLYAEQFAEVKALNAALNNALDGYRGEMGGEAGSVEVFFSLAKGEGNNYTDDPELYLIQRDYLIMFE